MRETAPAHAERAPTTGTPPPTLTLARVGLRIAVARSTTGRANLLAEPRCILIVEDQRDILRIMQFILERDGYMTFARRPRFVRRSTSWIRVNPTFCFSI